MTEEKFCECCDACGEELYSGDVFYRIGLRKLCPECLRDFAEDFFADAREHAE